LPGYVGLKTIIQARTDVTRYNTQKVHEIMEGQKQHPVDDEENESQRRGRPMTREAIEQLRQIREEIMKDRNGELFEDSTEMIRQMREERTEELMQAVTAQNDEEEESTTTEQIVPDEANKASRQWRPVTSETFERLRQIREEIMKDRNGELFEDSAEILRREREKRTEYLMQVFTGQYGKDPYEEDTSEEQS
jgi:hypothetical protein